MSCGELVCWLGMECGRPAWSGGRQACSQPTAHSDPPHPPPPHHPPCRYNQRPENGGQRIATVLMYLSTPEEGGETVFPYAEKKVQWVLCVCLGLDLDG